MEISHNSTETQSAAVGIKGKAEEATVSTDADFMMLIAHGIYSNKPLALVRELLCNARDGHAKAGCLDKPIHVTLTDNKLVVRDRGTGIPNNIFTATYLTFGKSTKRKDKAATGGFGVGSKVPWAVCDTFSARNFIDGTMTAYSITKSDPKLDGKPSCTPVISVPSKEPSGVEVSVPFPEKMHKEIDNAIKLFTSELGIPIIYNGVLIQSSDAFGGKELKEKGFFRAPRHPQSVIQQSTFYIRQGDVLYPVEPHDDFNDAWQMLHHLAPQGNYPLILMAKPDSIIPTLSRESLQYTERTIQSIRELMKTVLQDIANHVDKFAEDVGELMPLQFKGHVFLQSVWNNQFDMSKQLPIIYRTIRDSKLTETMNDMLYTNMHRWLVGRTPYLETKKTVAAVFRKNLQDQAEAVFSQSLLEQPGLDPARLIRIWQDIKSRRNTYNSRDAALHRDITRNAYEELMFWREEMRGNPDIVDVYYPKDRELIIHSYSGASQTFEMTTVFNDHLDKRKLDYLHGREYLCDTLYLNNTVVISHQPSVMLDRAREQLPNTGGNYYAPNAGRLAQLVGARIIRVRAQTKPDEIKIMKELYESWGYKVITLLKPTQSELDEKALAGAERAKEREIPLPQLHELIRENIPTYPEIARVQARKKLRGLMANPDFKGKPLYLMLNRGKELPHGIANVNQFYRLAKFIGTDIVCISTKAELAKVIKQGRTNVDDAMLAFAQWFFRRRDIYEKLFWRNTMFHKRAMKNRILTKYLFNVEVPTMSNQDTIFYEALIEFSKFCPKLKEYVNARISYFNTACSSEAHYTKLFTRYADQNFCDVFRALDVAYSSTPSHKRTVARAILKTILKEKPA